MDYRDRNDGAIYSTVALKNKYKNVSLPKVWTQTTLDSLGVDPIYESDPPSVESNQKAVQSGTVKNSDGQWVYAWSVEALFKDYTVTDSEGNETTVTAEEQLAAKTKADTDSLALSARNKRNDLLKETDHYGLSDVTMSDAMTTYRQALRDVPQQEGFPETITWPTKPE